MATHELIDTQFDRAVEIVQSLPKTGPIQTDYEEKLTMYSLFKQATVGNVKSPRPGMWDMLGRAKWDAWEKHKDLDRFEAKWLYVEALLKVLRRYSDKTVAMNLVQELESYGGDPSNIVMSRTFSKSPGSDASGSTASEVIAPYPRPPGLATHNLENDAQGEETDSTSDEGESEDEAHELPVPNTTPGCTTNNLRPRSSHSSRYRTPLAASLVTSPPPQQLVPLQQPLPGFETPSAFAETVPESVSLYPTTQALPGSYHESSRPETVSPPHLYHSHPTYRPTMQSHSSQYAPPLPTSVIALERAVESVQGHLAALTERLESLESRSILLSRSNVTGSPRGAGSPSWAGDRRSPHHGNGEPFWDVEDLGMWSIILNPLSRGVDRLKLMATFFARNEGRSPSMIIIRRLCLDVSFLLCAIAVIGALWRKTSTRRREIRSALGLLWRAIVGSKPSPPTVDRGV